MPSTKVEHFRVESKPANKSSLHKNLKHVLIFGQLLGLLPVRGVANQSPQKLVFTFKSFRSVYCLVTTLATVFVVLMLVIKLAKSGSSFNLISTLIYHLCKLANTLSFLHLARKWSKIMLEWKNIEDKMKNYEWKDNFSLRIYFTLIFIMGVSIGQYITDQISNVIISNKCKPSNATTDEYFYKALTFPYVFSMLDYSIFTALLLQLVDLISALIWSYVDVFIIIMSSALALRFELITNKLYTTVCQKDIHPSTWKIIREDYTKVCKLCRLLDDGMSYVILMSFTSNLFFILIQLFNSLRLDKNDLDKVYFYFSFGFLILRSVYVALYASWVNEASKQPATILNSVSSDIYNEEIKRFLIQLSFDSVALTGRNFFNVTRGIILNIAGAIVTYELVLIQFNENILKTNSGTLKACVSY